jgi:hypothetical protein
MNAMSTTKITTPHDPQIHKIRSNPLPNPNVGKNTAAKMSGLIYLPTRQVVDISATGTLTAGRRLTKSGQRFIVMPQIGDMM